MCILFSFYWTFDVLVGVTHTIKTSPGLAVIVYPWKQKKGWTCLCLCYYQPRGLRDLLTSTLHYTSVSFTQNSEP